jgi:hypothetical protein
MFLQSWTLSLDNGLRMIKLFTANYPQYRHPSILCDSRLHFQFWTSKTKTRKSEKRENKTKTVVQTVTSWQSQYTSSRKGGVQSRTHKLRTCLSWSRPSHEWSRISTLQKNKNHKNAELQTCSRTANNEQTVLQACGKEFVGLEEKKHYDSARKSLENDDPILCNSLRHFQFWTSKTQKTRRIKRKKTAAKAVTSCNRNRYASSRIGGVQSRTHSHYLPVRTLATRVKPHLEPPKHKNCKYAEIANFFLNYCQQRTNGTASVRWRVCRCVEETKQ